MAAWERGAAGHQRGGMEGSRPPGFAVRHLADHLRSRSWALTRDLGEHTNVGPAERGEPQHREHRRAPRFWSATACYTVVVTSVK